MTVCSGFHKGFCSEQLRIKGCLFCKWQPANSAQYSRGKLGPLFSFIMFHHKNSVRSITYLLASAFSDRPSCCWWICSHTPSNPRTMLPCQLGLASGSLSLWGGAGTVSLIAVEYSGPWDWDSVNTPGEDLLHKKIQPVYVSFEVKGSIANTIISLNAGKQHLLLNCLHKHTRQICFARFHFFQ